MNTAHFRQIVRAWHPTYARVGKSLVKVSFAAWLSALTISVIGFGNPLWVVLPMYLFALCLLIGTSLVFAPHLPALVQHPIRWWKWIQTQPPPTPANALVSMFEGLLRFAATWGGALLIIGIGWQAATERSATETRWREQVEYCLIKTQAFCDDPETWALFEGEYLAGYVTELTLFAVLVWISASVSLFRWLYRLDRSLESEAPGAAGYWLMGLLLSFLGVALSDIFI